MTKSDEKSYDKIDYTLRPAKSIERKMLCEVFRRLFPFGKVQDYRYIGFGSAYFADFVLFHKMLFIQDMISIEDCEKYEEARFNFNKPFSCINIEFGDSNKILPKLKWDKRTILWLDYDFSLNNSILEDIRHAFTSAENGSVIIITVDGSIRQNKGHGAKVESDKLNGDLVKKDKLKLNYLKKNISESKVPIDIRDGQLNGWNISKVYRRIIENEIMSTIRARNGGRSEGNKLLYKQLFNFHYDDSTKMLTVGGIIFDEGLLNKFEKCGFDDLSFIKQLDEPYLIKVPKLTLREIKKMDKYLPTDFERAPDFLLIDKKEQYKKIYKYFPHFAEIEA